MSFFDEPRRLRFEVLRLVVAGVTAAFAVAACGGDPPEFEDPGPCDPDEDLACPGDEVCERVEGGDPACFEPVRVVGVVTDLSTEEGIIDARVVAIGADGIPISRYVPTETGGAFTLRVPATRNTDGKPVSATFTLRAEAFGYQSFPVAPRLANVLDLGNSTGDPFVLDKPEVDVVLIASGTMQKGSVGGKVGGDSPAGTLVEAGGEWAIADVEGDYEIGNIPIGDVLVHAYKPGQGFDVASARVASFETTAVDLTPNDDPLGAISGDVTLDGPSKTTLTLAPFTTYQPAMDRAAPIPGFRVVVEGDRFTIDDVPPGAYVLVVADANDGAVLDPATALTKLDVNGGGVETPEPIRVVRAIEVVTPGALAVDTVTKTPVFTWRDAIDEAEYEIDLFDVLGNEVWRKRGDFAMGAAQATVTFDGDPLRERMLFRFRVTALDAAGDPLARTEISRGIFLYK